VVLDGVLGEREALRHLFIEVSCSLRGLL
jgi:hypothetical protein